MMQVITDTYSGSDDVVFAYAVLSAIAPKSANCVRVVFGYKRSVDADYTLVAGGLENSAIRKWSAKAEGLIPGATYDFIAYSENAQGLFSTVQNPTEQITVAGTNTLPDSIINKVGAGSNLGSGAGIFKEKSGTTLTFKTLLQGNNITITGEENEVRLDGSGLSFPSATEVTIESGEILLVGRNCTHHHTVDTEGDAASDFLTDIRGGAVGDLLLLKAENDAREVIVQTTGNISLASSTMSLMHGEAKLLLLCTAFGTWAEFGRISPGFEAHSELTISGGEITVPGYNKFRSHTVDTESDAATDDLDTINGGYPGDLLILFAQDPVRVVTVKDGTNIKSAGDFALDTNTKTMLLFCLKTGEWWELSRSAN